jgi:metallo-beta-lactamase class B
MKDQRMLMALFVLLFTACKGPSAQQRKSSNDAFQPKTSADTGVVYHTDTLLIRKLSPHVYVHTSFLQTNTFGKVDCNGMIVVKGKEAVVFDTPADDASTAELIRYVTTRLQSTIKAIIPTHFHEDCVGGLEQFHANGIPVYASRQTIALLDREKRKFSKPFYPFDSSLVLSIGSEKVYAQFFGEGHTKDNITGYFPEDNALFGGCLIKTLEATKGNLADANVKEWPVTVLKLKQKYPELKIVIPGHGKWGSSNLLDYTIRLFE